MNRILCLVFVLATLSVKPDGAALPERQPYTLSNRETMIVHVIFSWQRSDIEFRHRQQREFVLSVPA